MSPVFAFPRKLRRMSELVYEIGRNEVSSDTVVVYWDIR